MQTRLNNRAPTGLSLIHYVRLLKIHFIKIYYVKYVLLVHDLTFPIKYNVCFVVRNHKFIYLVHVKSERNAFSRCQCNMYAERETY